MPPAIPDLSATSGYIFRITHVDNIEHILFNGVCCRNHQRHNPNYVNIGNPDLIGKRHRQIVPQAPGGTLSDYAPFYFTPHSLMLLNIKSGRNGVVRRGNEQIVFILSSIDKLINDKVPYLFTDRHASTAGVEFFTDPAELDRIDWGIIRARDFRRDEEDPGKLVRYQAEALVHGELPIGSILAITCFSEAVRLRVKALVDAQNYRLRVTCRPDWYFL